MDIQRLINRQNDRLLEKDTETDDKQIGRGREKNDKIQTEANIEIKAAKQNESKRKADYIPKECKLMLIISQNRRRKQGSS